MCLIPKIFLHMPKQIESLSLVPYDGSLHVLKYRQLRKYVQALKRTTNAQVNDVIGVQIADFLVFEKDIAFV